jgi:hypothetical protein
MADPSSKRDFFIRSGRERQNPNFYTSCIFTFLSQSYKYLLRDEDDAESIRELESMIEMGQEFYAESGNLYKMVGILRAADIYWNPAKR